MAKRFPGGARKKDLAGSPGTPRGGEGNERRRHSNMNSGPRKLHARVLAWLRGLGSRPRDELPSSAPVQSCEHQRGGRADITSRALPLRPPALGTGPAPEAAEALRQHPPPPPPPVAAAPFTAHRVGLQPKPRVRPHGALPSGVPQRNRRRPERGSPRPCLRDLREAGASRCPVRPQLWELGLSPP